MRRREPWSRLLVWSWLAAALATQEPPAAETTPPAAESAGRQGAAVPEVPAAERELGERLLRRHAERSRDVRVLVADYVQRRTTELSTRPLLSSGAFLFVAEPACVVFRAAKPRPSVVRLTRDCYEVYRPAQRRLERFHLGGPQLAVGLFAAVAGDADRLLRDFVIAGAVPVHRPDGEPRPVGGPERAERVAVRLLPRSDAIGRHLRELQITLEGAEGRLCAISYRDASGDLVAIELSALRSNPESAPNAELGLPADVQVVEHAPPADAGDALPSGSQPKAEPTSPKRDQAR